MFENLESRPVWWEQQGRGREQGSGGVAATQLGRTVVSSRQHVYSWAQQMFTAQPINPCPARDRGD